MKTLDEMIREYRIELYKACDGRIGLQAWKYKGKPGAEEEIRANKDALVAELVRRERKRKTNEERKHREHIFNLQKEYPVNLPDLNVGDLVAWYDQRMPFSYGIRRADSICTGEAFDWDPEYVIILSLDHGESLAEELSVECGSLTHSRLANHWGWDMMITSCKCTRSFATGSKRTRNVEFPQATPPPPTITSNATRRLHWQARYVRPSQ